jgi:hypothetical protein
METVIEETDTLEASAPQFLESIVSPIVGQPESRLGKMCSCFSYGS